VDANPDIDFLIVRGWGETDNYMFDRQNVTIWDFQVDVTKVWEVTKILCVLSITDAYPRVIGEAISGCCKVIATNIGGISEVSNGLAVLVKPLTNRGTETYPIFDELEYKLKISEISAIIQRELLQFDPDKIRKESIIMSHQITKNNATLITYINSVLENLNYGTVQQ
jgi:glycosyltransferase involved in cell wall biosynthesis